MSDRHLTSGEEMGKRLREARERKGWSLEDVSQKTRISNRHLVSLERGDLSAMPAHVYARGFVRMYAKMLELEEEPLMRMLDELGVYSATASPTGAAPRPEESTPPLARVPVLAARGHLVPTRVWIAAAGVVVGGLLIGLAIRGVFGIIDAENDREIPPSPFVAETKGKSGVTKKVSRSRPEARRVELMERDAKPTEAGLRPVRISVTASDDCWMAIQVDEDSPEEMTLKGGESRQWAGAKRIRALIGNSGGVAVSLGGAPVALPEKNGKVVHLLFTVGGIEKLEVPRISGTTGTSSTVLAPSGKVRETPSAMRADPTGIPAGGAPASPGI